MKPLPWMTTGAFLALAIPSALAQRGLGIGHTGIVGGPPGGVAGGVTGGAAGVGQANAGPGRNPAETPRNRPITVPSPAASQLTQNSALSAQLQPLVPAGSTVPAAATGFRNTGEFAATLHVAHNLNVPFDQLKSQVTGPKAVPLGKAIHNLRPDLDDKTVKENVQLAERQRERDVRQANTKQDRVSGRIASDTALATRISPLLPQGMTAASAASGFKNEGQFLAALHVAKNLNIPFVELKDRMTAGESLGASIHALRPELGNQAVETASAEAEAQAEADRDGRSSATSVSGGASVRTGATSATGAK